jgi:isoaspartyl peptidase/L-asparaginase-like protein (Ntn-hydrolase superfamily)
MLAGDSAARYVLEGTTTGYGESESLCRPEQVAPESMVSPRAQKELEYWHNRLTSTEERAKAEKVRIPMGDTVGAIVVCEGGDMAAGVSRLVSPP